MAFEKEEDKKIKDTKQEGDKSPEASKDSDNEKK